MPKKLTPLLLSLLSGTLLWASWPTSPLTFLIFAGFVPLLKLENVIARREDIKRPAWTFFGYTYLAFLIWNGLTTWWVGFASPGGAITAIIANSLLMSVPFLLYRRARRIIHQKLAFISLPVFWIGFEYLHLNWDISWPWLTVGNVFAQMPSWIQWYEYTGVLGGTLWVFLINIILFWALQKKYFTWEYRYPAYWLLTLFFVLSPILISWQIEKRVVVKTGNPTEVVVLQPNIDPYGEKFKGGVHFIKIPEQIRRHVEQSEQTMTDSTKFVIWPETAIQKEYLNDNQERFLYQNPVIRQVRRFAQRHPNTSLVSGLECWEKLQPAEVTPFSYHNHRMGHYEPYNAGVQVYKDSLSLYHKSKLVPGVEILPFPHILGWLTLIIDFEHAGNYGRQEDRTVFWGPDSIGVAPMICYESIYGEYVGDFVENGAQLLFIMTNDGWWKDTEGHRQHNLYARLLAISHRRDIARSANTGVSSFINKKGEFIEESGWWEKVTLKQSLYPNEEITYYSKHGNFLGRWASVLSILLIISISIKRKVS